jgi:thioredoxin-related protein
MKYLIIAIKVFTIGTLAFINPKNDFKTLTAGTKAPMITAEMATTSGTNVSLDQLKKENGLLVIFSCNTCPFVVGTGDKEGWEGRYNQLNELCTSFRIGSVLLNSNEAKRPTGGDNMEDMVARAEKMNYKMTYALDYDSKLANAFGAKTTPHVFLFDKELKLIYSGKIDDNVDSKEAVKQTFLRDAITNHINGKEIDPDNTPALGCSIKREG